MKKSICYLMIFLLISCNESSKKEEKQINQNESTLKKEVPEKLNNEDYTNQIIPGERLGSIILNENATAVFDSLDKPESGDAAMGKAISTWHENSDKLLSIYTTTQMGVEDFSRIKAIRSLSPDFKTENNLGVNSSLAEIEKYFELNKAGTFSFENEKYILYSSEEGIGFEVDEGGKCQGIVLTEKGTSPERHYLTFYPDLKK